MRLFCGLFLLITRIPIFLGIPKSVIELHKKTKGMVLVGSRRKRQIDTLACIVDKIGNSRKYHIMTLETAIEFCTSIK